MVKRILLALAVLLLPLAAQATVTSTDSTVTFTCTDSTGPFAFTFPALDATSLRVIEILPDAPPGVMTVLASDQWTSTPVNNSYANGGSVTLVSPCPTGDTLVIARATDLTQLTHYTPYMPALYANFENNLDQLTTGRQDAFRATQVYIGASGGSPSVTHTPLGQYINLPASGGSPSGVSQIIAGTDISISPPGGTGAVTINATGCTAGSSGFLIVSTSTNGQCGNSDLQYTFDGTDASVLTTPVNGGNGLTIQIPQDGLVTVQGAGSGDSQGRWVFNDEINAASVSYVDEVTDVSSYILGTNEERCLTVVPDNGTPVSGITLPDANGATSAAPLVQGVSFCIFNNQDASLTVTPAGSDTINGNNSAITLPAYGAISLENLNVILPGAHYAWAVIGTSYSTGVSSFSGDGALLSNSASTGAVTATLATAGAHEYWGNDTGSTATPAYYQPAFTDLSGTLGTTQGPSSLTGLLYDTAGTLSTASLTTTSNYNAATLSGSTLNIPVYGTSDANGNQLLLGAGPSGGIASGAGISDTLLWGQGAGAALGTASAIVTTGTASSSSTTLDVASTAGLIDGMNVSATGIASGTTISSIGDVPLTVSQTLTGNVSSATISVTTTATASSGSQNLTVASASGIYPGMVPSATGIGTNNLVIAVSGTSVKLLWNTTASLSATSITFSATGAASGTDGGTSISWDATGWMPVAGEAITGTGIPASTTISSISSTAITLSAETIGSVSGNVSFTYAATTGSLALGLGAAGSAYTLNGTFAMGIDALQNCTGVNAGGESDNGIYVGPYTAEFDPCLNINGTGYTGDFEPMVFGNKAAQNAVQLIGTVALGNHSYGIGSDQNSVFAGTEILSGNWGISTGSIVNTLYDLILGGNALNGGPPSNNTDYSMTYDLLLTPGGATCFFNSTGNLLMGYQIDAQSSCTSGNLFSGHSNIYIAEGESGEKFGTSWTSGAYNVVMVTRGYGGVSGYGGGLTSGANGNTDIGPGAGPSTGSNYDQVNVGNNTDSAYPETVTLGNGAVAGANYAIEINSGSTAYTNSTSNTMQVWNLPIASIASFSVSGCGTAGSLTGSGLAGTFTAGATSCTPVITTGVTTPNGYSCEIHDRASPTTLFAFESSSTTTTVTFPTLSVTSGDTMSFKCGDF